MPKRSRRHGQQKSSKVEIKTGVVPGAPIVDLSKVQTHLNGESVSISLRYFQSSCECFSDWEKHELKKFSATIKKIRGYNAELLKRTLNLCDIHKGKPGEERFSIPEDLSPEIRFHELKVDPSNKLRIHGFFAESVFFLVWLDRKHACFPS